MMAVSDKEAPEVPFQFTHLGLLGQAGGLLSETPVTPFQVVVSPAA